MAQLAAQDMSSSGQVLRAPEKPIKILAKTLFRELRTQGYEDKQIVALSTELIGLLTTDIRDDER